MLRRNRTKFVVLLICAAFAVLVYFGYSGPSSDRPFVLKCLVVLGVVVTIVIATARVLRCPRCDADMGRFENLPIMGRLHAIRPRYVECRFCGCVLDRYRDNREVD